MFKESGDEIQKLIAISLVIAVLGIVVLFSDYIKTQRSFNGVLERPKAGEGELIEKLILTREDGTLVKDVTISEVEYEGHLVERLFNTAITEIEATVLGSNQTQDYVTDDLDLRESYVDGLITASWKLSDYSIMNAAGHLRKREIPKEGSIITISATLHYMDYEYLYEFLVHVHPPDISTEEGFIMALDEALAKSNEATKTKTVMNLPSKVGGESVNWKQPMNYRGLQLAILGAVAAVGIFLSRGQQERQNQKEMEDYFLADYPEIVSNLSILLGAGISFKGAVGRMSKHYVYERDEGLCELRPGMEELLILGRELSDGVGEATAIENLGRRVKVKEYRKLAMLLTQNLKKGSRELIEMLEKEDALAFELKKARALQAGEKASTKMLLPMGGMLLIVIVILVLPAVMQMNI